MPSLFSKSDLKTGLYFGHLPKGIFAFNIQAAVFSMCPAYAERAFVLKLPSSFA